MTRSNTIALVAVAAAAGPLFAGCGSSPSHTAGQAARSPAQAAFAYARCIREHGVPAFPDPQVVTTPGSVGIRQAVPASAGLSPKFTAAQRACRDILPAVQNGGSNHHSPLGKQALLAFARCLRARGETGFPDPNAQGDLNIEAIRAAGIDMHAPQFAKAAYACVGATHGQITSAMVAAAISHQ